MKLQQKNGLKNMLFRFIARYKFITSIIISIIIY